MIILSIETSCDETAAALVRFEKDKIEILSDVVSSQIKAHSKFGGVVPSLASRMHLNNMIPVLKRVFEKAGKKVFPKELSRMLSGSELSSFGNMVDYIAVANGPGLIPALMIGISSAKTLSYALDKPLIPINHLEGHIYSNWLKPIEKPQAPRSPKPQENSLYDLWQPEFPILCLIVSGGHTQLVLMKKDLDYRIIGETVDDAAGEAFDKVAKLLDLGYPGGPLIEKIAREGNEKKFDFPRPMIKSNDYNFSFSGLKTAVLYEMRHEIQHTPNSVKTKHFPHSPLEMGQGCVKLAKDSNNTLLYPLSRGEFAQFSDSLNKVELDDQYKADIAASFQQAVLDVLISKTIRAAKEYKAKNILLGGGVSANNELRKQLKKAIKEEVQLSTFHFPPSNFSTDNALMISIAAYKHVLENKGVGSWESVRGEANLGLE